jgi:putative membrane protein
MSKRFWTFIARWLLNSFGLWIAVRLFGTGYNNTDVAIGLVGFLTAGLIFSIINSIIRPFFIVLSLPAIILSLGIFTLIVNGLMVYISLKIAPGISMTFWNSILTGIILSLVNYIVSATLVLRTSEKK